MDELEWLLLELKVVIREPGPWFREFLASLDPDTREILWLEYHWNSD